MKAFMISLAVLVVVSVGAAFVLENFSRPAENHFKSNSVRLN